jgi:hypothetical protein
MSYAPKSDTQLLRDPVDATTNVFPTLQSVVPLSPPGSGVPVTPTCHSALVECDQGELLPRRNPEAT